MKTMRQMQDDLLSKCKFDGSYPKPVIVGMGCVALAYSKEEEDELIADNIKAWKWAAILGFFLPIVICVSLKIFGVF